MSNNKTTKFLSREAALKSRQWIVVDAAEIPVGRLASEVAKRLKGKHRPDYTPHVDCGDFVVVINAEKTIFTGKKRSQKRYYRHTGYIGGIKFETADERFEKYPERIIQSAIKGMLPKGALTHQILKKLKVYVGNEHPHSAQNPTIFEVKAA